jgi:hypothetical protein
MPEYSYTHAYPDRYTEIFESSGGSSDLRYDNTRRDYYLDYSVEIIKWVVVVDWGFKHLGGGFEPLID